MFDLCGKNENLGQGVRLILVIKTIYDMRSTRPGVTTVPSFSQGTTCSSCEFSSKIPGFSSVSAIMICEMGRSNRAEAKQIFCYYENLFKADSFCNLMIVILNLLSKLNQNLI